MIWCALCGVPYVVCTNKVCVRTVKADSYRMSNCLLCLEHPMAFVLRQVPMFLKNV